MATNGVYGFRKNGVEKLNYQHGDAYLECLGREILQFIKLVETKRMISCFDNIEMKEGNSDFEYVDLGLYVTGEETSMINGDKYYADYKYILDLDKKVLEYKCPGGVFEISFKFIKSNKIDSIMEFIEVEELKKKFDSLELEKLISKALKDKNNFFVLEIDRCNDFDFTSRYSEDFCQECNHIDNDIDEEDISEDTKYILLWDVGRQNITIDTLDPKIKAVVEKVERKHDIKIQSLNIF
ncbi:gp614 [Bacillus phage G]|uniref:Gp614 n=1 Tax=Bacillus phage G TaxID=2884420 RepID=G3MAZ4_9CAUD|nr:gp614 [Bacillus phage G]AEO93859.1 gp614 [Bacillus phage G]